MGANRACQHRASSPNRQALGYDLQMIRLLLLVPVLALAQDPIAPHSAFEPPAAKAAASLAASTKDSPPDLITTGEKTDWNETAPYAEAVEISHRLEKASRFVKVSGHRDHA